MRVRRALVQSIVVALVSAGIWTWSVTRPASGGSYLVAATILFLPIAALQVIIRVGGVLLADEKARTPNTDAEFDI